MRAIVCSVARYEREWKQTTWLSEKGCTRDTGMTQQVASQNNKPQSFHFITFSVILFLIILVVSSAAFLFSMRKIIRDNKADELTRMLDMERIKLEISVNSKIAIILMVSKSPLIMRYFNDPQNRELEIMAFEELESYRKALSESIFWINDVDKKFYFDKKEPYTVDPKLPENYWYDMTLYRTEDYNFNINYNPDINMINLWINAPVFDKERQPIGMVGSGVDVSAFIKRLYDVYKGRADLYFFNAKGEITGARDIELVIAKEHIDKELSNVGGILARAKNLKPDQMQTFNSPLGMVAVGTVPALEWYSVAIMPDSINDYRNHVSVVFIVMLAMIALIIVIFNLFITGFVRSLRKTMDSLEATSHYKSEFLARMSHEIRTPMNAIIGMSELALREQELQHVLEHVHTIKRSGTNLLSIINDILDFSKIESGKLEIIPVDYLFPTLIDDIANIIRIKVMESQLEFRVNIDDGIPKTLFGDNARLRQVVLNILNNAVKYTPAGFVSLTVYGKVVDADKVILTIEIADSGRGIKEEDIGRLFDDFEQLDLMRNKNIEGTGLGLAITKNLLAAMGGGISVRSEYGKGSTFTATLPQGISRKEISDSEGTASKFRAPDAKILVVDDVAINRMVAKGLLTLYEVQIRLCGSGEEAIKAVQAEEYDLVFMDHMMPGMDGIEATAIIRGLEDERFQKLPIVALTANAISGMKEMYLKNGFNDYLSKPIDVQKLNALLEKWIPKEKQQKLDG